MPRWEPNARARLERAAFDLFEQRGYDSTTAQEIAAAAGLARSSFFRYFRDKHEILFGGEEGLATRIGADIREAPTGLTPLAAIEAALTRLGADWFTQERRDLIVPRNAIVAAHPALRERESAKRADIVRAVTAALQHRGVDEYVAIVSAAIAGAALSRAIADWARQTPPMQFEAAVRRELLALSRAAGAVS